MVVGISNDDATVVGVRKSGGSGQLHRSCCIRRHCSNQFNCSSSILWNCVDCRLVSYAASSIAVAAFIVAANAVVVEASSIAVDASIVV